MMGSPQGLMPAPTWNGPKPTVQMRKLHWDAIQRPVEGSIWGDLAKQGSMIEIDFEDFESTFAEPSNAKPVQTKKEVVKEKPKVITIVDAKKAYNLGIALARFKMTHDVIRKNIVSMNEAVMSEEKLEALIKYAPEERELKQLREQHEDVARFGEAEKFYLTINLIKRYTERLTASLFKIQFPHWYRNCTNMANTLEAARAQVVGSKSLKIVFQIILAFGNFMNANSRLGQASGFKIETLTKVKSSKSSDGKISLLEYLVKYMTKHSPEARGFVNELSSVFEAARIDSTALSAEVVNLTGRVKSLESEIAAHEKIEQRRQDRLKKRRQDDMTLTKEQKKKAIADRAAKRNKYLDLDDDEEDRFLPILKVFHTKAIEQVKKLEEKVKKLEADNKALVKYFGGNDSMIVENFHGILAGFMNEYTQADIALTLLMAEKEKKDAKAAETAAKAEAKAQAARAKNDLTKVDLELANSEEQAGKYRLDCIAWKHSFLPAC
jgi:hypothetical protein